MRRQAPFIWIDWNQTKIDSHNLSESEVEFAWRYRFADEADSHPVRGEFFRSYGPCPSGRVIKIVWRWNPMDAEDGVFVITAYGNWRKKSDDAR